MTQHIVQDGDQILLFRLLQGVEMLRIADKTFDSHLFTGTGKFASSQLMVEAIRASGSQLVTLAMKRVDLRQHNDAILEPAYRGGCDPAAKYIRGEKQRKKPFSPPIWLVKR
ncbi:Thiamin biosynthesis, thiazole moiety [Escherichia coli]|nr:Thiamin biosynthesis, thiazole moiety [Escherichia coli]